MPRDIQREKPDPAGIDREKADQIAADMTGRAHQQRKVEIAETAMAFPHQALLQALRLAHVAVDGGLGFAQLVQRLLELGIGIAQALFHAQDAFAGRQPRQQFRTRDRLGQEFIGPRPQPFGNVLLVVARGQQDEIAVFVGLHVAELATELQPALARDDPVGNDDVGTPLKADGHGLIAVLGLDHMIAGADQLHGERAPLGPAVIDQQDHPGISRNRCQSRAITYHHARDLSCHR